MNRDRVCAASALIELLAKIVIIAIRDTLIGNRRRS